MALPAPHLDDRHFQDLVDEAKRLVQQRCPEWTDHNVSDPGVTLIEAFAQMVDQLIYRLNRVPDRNYVKFLELIGVELLPPAPARGQVTFWLSAAQPQTVTVRADSRVATPRTDVSDPVVFSTTRDLKILSCTFQRAATETAGQAAEDRTAALDAPDGFACFGRQPRAGDALLVGLSTAVPWCAVLIRVDCPVLGIGVDPEAPPLVWEAWTGDGWKRCEVDRDGTGGLNKPGDVVLHVPGGHQESVIAEREAGWLRCRLRPIEATESGYQRSPRILSLRAYTIGGTVDVEHSEPAGAEELGTSDGTPGQSFPLARGPVVRADAPPTLEVSGDGGWQPWAAVRTFADCTADSRCFRLDAAVGEVALGPAVRQPDGTVRRYGAVPPRGATVRLTGHRTGGGRLGNVPRGAIRVIKTSLPYVATVANRVPAVGGVEAETVENAKLRGPVLVRSRGRAVTAEDFEHLAREADPGVGRVRCLTATDPAEAGGVRVVVVPQLPDDRTRGTSLADLRPPDAMLSRIRARLNTARLVGTSVLVVPPAYRGLTVVVAEATLAPGHDREAVREDLLTALYRYLDPLHGGAEGIGWPFGRTVRHHEMQGMLAAVPGVDLSGDVRVELYPSDDEGTRTRRPVDRLDLPPNGLVRSYAHWVEALR